MPMFTPDKALRDLPKTPVILSAILAGVDQARAQSATDGAEGWSVVQVVCHLNDFEQIFFDRARQMVNSEMPRFASVDQDMLAQTNHYADQILADVLASYVSKRRAHLAFLRGLTPGEWTRRGVHPSAGEMTITENATNTTLHDVNHIEQIVKALGTSSIAAL